MNELVAPPTSQSFPAPLQVHGDSLGCLRLSPSTSVPPSCPICFDSVDSLSSPCGPRCAVCKSCFEEHIRVTLEDTIMGILPRVRCPVCLARLHKQKWRRLVSSDLVHLYKRLCMTACSFLPPCCHDPRYTQLPEPLTRPQPRFEKVMAAQLHDDLPQLRSLLRQFATYGTTARDVVAWIDVMARRAGFTDLSFQEFVDTVAVRILDDERRASLILAYHAVHKRVITRCCLRHVCFNCKRQWNASHDEDPLGQCDEVELSDSEVVQCRSCNVTLVKVEGCNAVTCPCGFAMDWSTELMVREQFLRALIPAHIDIYEIERFRAWDEWRSHLKWTLLPEANTVRAENLRARVDHYIRVHRSPLRLVLLTYIWRKRFRERISELECEIKFVRLRFLAKQLRESSPFRKAVHTFASVAIPRRLCLKQILRAVPRYDEEHFSAQDADIECGLFS